MRILMPVDVSEYSKAAIAFVASRATLLKNPTEGELINRQYRVPLLAATRVASRCLTALPVREK